MTIEWKTVGREELTVLISVLLLEQNICYDQLIKSKGGWRCGSYLAVFAQSQVPSTHNGQFTISQF